MNYRISQKSPSPEKRTGSFSNLKDATSMIYVKPVKRGFIVMSFFLNKRIFIMIIGAMLIGHASDSRFSQTIRPRLVVRKQIQSHNYCSMQTI